MFWLEVHGVGPSWKGRLGSRNRKQLVFTAGKEGDGCWDPAGRLLFLQSGSQSPSHSSDPTLANSLHTHPEIDRRGDSRTCQVVNHS